MIKLLPIFLASLLLTACYHPQNSAQNTIDFSSKPIDEKIAYFQSRLSNTQISHENSIREMLVLLNKNQTQYSFSKSSSRWFIAKPGEVYFDATKRISIVGHNWIKIKNRQTDIEFSANIWCAGGYDDYFKKLYTQTSILVLNTETGSSSERYELERNLNVFVKAYFAYHHPIGYRTKDELHELESQLQYNPLFR